MAGHKHYSHNILIRKGVAELFVVIYNLINNPSYHLNPFCFYPFTSEHIAASYSCLFHCLFDVRGPTNLGNLQDNHITEG